MFELIRVSEIKKSMVFNLDFDDKTILSCFFFFLIIDLYFLIPAVIAQLLIKPRIFSTSNDSSSLNIFSY